MALKTREPHKAKEDTSTGLSNKLVTTNQRSIRDDGTFNVELRGLPWLRPYDLFQELITISWVKFLLIVFAAFFSANSFFAFIYFLLGAENLTAYAGNTKMDEFLHCFFFSAQSLTTVGYGRIAPITNSVSAVAAIESMVGLLIFALGTGLLYGRFSRPVAKIVHSKNILIAPYKDGVALMFRIANMRKTQLSEAEVSVTMAILETEPNGNKMRRFYPLKLELNRIIMFPLSWTVVHHINEESLLYGKTLPDMEAEETEFMIYFKAYDETFSNTVHYRISYNYRDLIWGAKFRLNFEQRPGKATLHHLDRINDFDKAELPVLIPQLA